MTDAAVHPCWVRSASMDSRERLELQMPPTASFTLLGRVFEKGPALCLAKPQIHVRGMLFHAKCLWNLQDAKACWDMRRHCYSLITFATVYIWWLEPNEQMLPPLTWVPYTPGSGIREHLPLQEKMKVTKSQESSLCLIRGTQLQQALPEHLPS